jgi:RND family efflux transporter MFP subunit
MIGTPFDRLLGLAAVLLPLLGTAGCGQRHVFKPPPPPSVTVARPIVRKVTDWIEFTGTTRATATVELRSRVKGYLQRIAFSDGMHVEAGDLLFVIEKTPFEAELESARANLAKSEAATQLAVANLARTTELVEKNAAPRQQLDVDTAQLATAKANQRAAQASVTQADLNLSYTEIRAPIAGRIGRHLLAEGNLVLPDQTLLAVIESIDPIHAYFYLSDRELLRFMEMLRQNELPDPEKQPPQLFLALENEEGFPHVGRLDFRAYGVDPSTGTAERRGIFPNKDLVLMPGLFVHIRAAVGAPRTRLLVEERAIAADQRGDYVLVVGKDKIVEHRPVKLGIAVGDLRVVERGIAQSDSVIVTGLQRARPGAAVDPKPYSKQAQAEALTRTKAEAPPVDEPAAVPDGGPSEGGRLRRAASSNQPQLIEWRLAPCAR